jgi:hypothetical protein
LALMLATLSEESTQKMAAMSSKLANKKLRTNRREASPFLIVAPDRLASRRNGIRHPPFCIEFA